MLFTFAVNLLQLKVCFASKSQKQSQKRRKTVRKTQRERHKRCAHIWLDLWHLLGSSTKAPTDCCCSCCCCSLCCCCCCTCHSETPHSRDKSQHKSIVCGGARDWQESDGERGRAKGCAEQRADEREKRVEGRERKGRGAHRALPCSEIHSNRK